MNRHEKTDGKTGLSYHLFVPSPPLRPDFFRFPPLPSKKLHPQTLEKISDTARGRLPSCPRELSSAGLEKNSERRKGTSHPLRPQELSSAVLGKTPNDAREHPSPPPSRTFICCSRPKLRTAQGNISPLRPQELSSAVLGQNFGRRRGMSHALTSRTFFRRP